MKDGNTDVYPVINALKDAIITEEITVVTNGSSDTYYKAYSKTVSKPGYTLMGAVGYRYNQVGFFCYGLTTTTSGVVTIQLANRSGSGTQSSVNAYVAILWLRNDLI